MEHRLFQLQASDGRPCRALPLLVLVFALLRKPTAVFPHLLAPLCLAWEWKALKWDLKGLWPTRLLLWIVGSLAVLFLPTYFLALQTFFSVDTFCGEWMHGVEMHDNTISFSNVDVGNKPDLCQQAVFECHKKLADSWVPNTVWNVFEFTAEHDDAGPKLDREKRPPRCHETLIPDYLLSLHMLQCLITPVNMVLYAINVKKWDITLYAIFGSASSLCFGWAYILKGTYGQIIARISTFFWDRVVHARPIIGDRIAGARLSMPAWFIPLCVHAGTWIVEILFFLGHPSPILYEWLLFVGTLLSMYCYAWVVHKTRVHIPYWAVLIPFMGWIYVPVCEWILDLWWQSQAVQVTGSLVPDVLMVSAPAVHVDQPLAQGPVVPAPQPLAQPLVVPVAQPLAQGPVVPAPQPLAQPLVVPVAQPLPAQVGLRSWVCSMFNCRKNPCGSNASKRSRSQMEGSERAGSDMMQVEGSALEAAGGVDNDGVAEGTAERARKRRIEYLQEIHSRALKMCAD